MSRIRNNCVFIQVTLNENTFISIIITYNLLLRTYIVYVARHSSCLETYIPFAEIALNAMQCEFYNIPIYSTRESCGIEG